MRGMCVFNTRVLVGRSIPRVLDTMRGMCVFNTRVLRFNACASSIDTMSCGGDGYTPVGFSLSFLRLWVCGVERPFWMLNGNSMLNGILVSVSPRRENRSGRLRTGSCVPSVSCPGSDSTYR